MQKAVARWIKHFPGSSLISRWSGFFVPFFCHRSVGAIEKRQTDNKNAKLTCVLTSRAQLKHKREWAEGLAVRRINKKVGCRSLPCGWSGVMKVCIRWQWILSIHAQNDCLCAESFMRVSSDVMWSTVELKCAVSMNITTSLLAINGMTELEESPDLQTFSNFLSRRTFRDPLRWSSDERIFELFGMMERFRTCAATL